MTNTRWTVFCAATVETFVLLMVALILLIGWYPGVYFQLFDMNLKFVYLALVSFLVGPCLSALIFKKGKTEFLNDLSVIYVVKVLAIYVAMYLFYNQRPLLLVFAVDRVVSVQAHQVKGDDLPPNIAKMVLEQRFPPVIAAREIDDKDMDLMLQIMAGASDIEFRPGSYEAIDYQVDRLLKRSALWLNNQKSTPSLSATNGRASRSLIPLPLAYGNDLYATALLDVNNKSLEHVLYSDPW